MGFTEVYDYVAGKLDWLAAALPVEGSAGPFIGDLAVDAPSCLMDHTVREAADLARTANMSLAVVVNEQDVVLGLLGPDQLESSPGARAHDVMVEGPSTYRPMVGPAEISETVEDAGFALVSRADGTLVGVVRPQELQ